MLEVLCIGVLGEAARGMERCRNRSWEGRGWHYLWKGVWERAFYRVGEKHVLRVLGLCITGI